jgi:hypothetical protein
MNASWVIIKDASVKILYKIANFIGILPMVCDMKNQCQANSGTHVNDNSWMYYLTIIK